jgi:hypothetical protein
VLKSSGASGGHDDVPTQSPLQQVWPEPQVKPQPPQLAESVESEMQSPSQQLLPGPQAGPEPQPSASSPPPGAPPLLVQVPLLHV